MPTLQFKGKSVIETYHHTVPHHRLEFDAKLSALPKGEKPSLDGNLIIEGDNLLALKALLPTHAGRVKCIYIDPPYNTGNEGWVYNDNLTQPQFKEWIGQTVGKEGEDACRHDKWCCMMYPRLELLKILLHPEDGVIIVSIDDNEIHHLRALMDELFGTSNLLATLVWEKGRKNDARFFSVGHEYALVYATSIEKLKSKGIVWRESKPGAQELWEKYVQLRLNFGDSESAIQGALRDWHDELNEKHPSKKLRRYLHVDKWGPWRDRDISWPGGGGPRYKVVHPVTKKPCAIPEAGWRFASPDEMQRQIDLGLVVFRDDHTKPPFRKAHLRPIPEEIIENDSEPDEEIGDDEFDIGLQVMGSYIYKQSQVAVRYLRDLMGPNLFENPKDYEVIARWIRYVTVPNDLVLDSFAGSGTTGQAVLEANRLDKDGQRKFVLIQQPHDTKEHERQRRNICETVTAPRVKKAIEKHGYSGSFTYARVSEPLFGEYKNFGKKLPSWEELARYVFYTETSRDVDIKRLKPETGFIGSTETAGGTSYYLLYTPDQEENQHVSLRTLPALLKKDSNKTLVIYAERIWLHGDELAKFEAENGRKIRPMVVPFGLR